MAYSLHHIRAMASSLMVSVLACMPAACQHKDLKDDAGQSFFPVVTVRYDWVSDEVSLPEGMANLFYNVDTPADSYWRSDFRPTGGMVRIPSGTYDAVTFNNDTRDIVFTGINSFEEFTFSTPETDLSGIPEEYLPFPPQKLYSQPDRIWAAVRNGLHIGFDAESLTFHFAPRRITREYQVVMTGIGHLESALQYYAALSDLAHGIKAATLSPTGEAVTMGGFMQPTDRSTISATILNFGPAPASKTLQLAVYIWLADGSRKVYVHDVTGQISDAPDPMNVLIRVEGPDLPEIAPGEGSGSGSGLDVGVDEWEFIDIEL